MFNRKNMSTRQRIDASHEMRMWINQVIIPAVTAAVFIDRMNPGLKYKIVDGVKNKVDDVKTKLHINKNAES